MLDNKIYRIRFEVIRFIVGYQVVLNKPQAIPQCFCIIPFWDNVGIINKFKALQCWTRNTNSGTIANI